MIIPDYKGLLKGLIGICFGNRPKVEKHTSIAIMVTLGAAFFAFLCSKEYASAPGWQGTSGETACPGSLNKA